MDLGLFHYDIFNSIGFKPLQCMAVLFDPQEENHVEVDVEVEVEDGVDVGHGTGDGVEVEVEVDINSECIVDIDIESGSGSRRGSINNVHTNDNHKNGNHNNSHENGHKNGKNGIINSSTIVDVNGGIAIEGEIKKKNSSDKKLLNVRSSLKINNVKINNEENVISEIDVENGNSNRNSRMNSGDHGVSTGACTGENCGSTGTGECVSINTGDIDIYSDRDSLSGFSTSFSTAFSTAACTPSGSSVRETPSNSLPQSRVASYHKLLKIDENNGDNNDNNNNNDLNHVNININYNKNQNHNQNEIKTKKIKKEDWKFLYNIEVWHDRSLQFKNEKDKLFDGV